MERAGGQVERAVVDRLVPEGGTGVVARCRHFVRASLAARGWLDDPGADQRAAVEDVLLMTSELVTNACLHAGGPVALTVSDAGWGRLRVEVLDASPEAPRVRPTTAPGRPGGHGLRVVRLLARRWGSEARPGGKAVWFEAAKFEAGKPEALP
ncbi:ATP-binding protein [Streptacidiphilus anmyonensis]|uniref:ATP-binding protein n=1 Tax=Streptacidiphilus anmyonensis TaxID=405782 RepID=UPI000B109B7E|nr:ATP-binding protein [Streptacidiphilus anmyonensis]